MRSGWVTKSYTYTEPVDPDSDTDAEYGANAKRKSGVTGPDTYADAIGNNADSGEFTKGYTTGYRDGWLKGFEDARKRYG